MYALFRPLLFHLQAERAHRLGIWAGRLGQTFASPFIASYFTFDDIRLRQSLWGLNFPNPIGLAAGFDKNARLIRLWQALGFGFAEIGSVSARKAKGNKRPRAFRLPEDYALINRMGLNNDGAAKIEKRVRRAMRGGTLPLGINLAKTHHSAITGKAALGDFCDSFRLLAPLAGYITLNISCPNTGDGKTFEDPNALDDLLRAIFAEQAQMDHNVPVLVKLSPPVSDRVVFDSLIDELLNVSIAHGVAGFVASNTASDRLRLNTSAKRLAVIGVGGISGAPIETRATQLVRYIYTKTRGDLPIIGVGGVASAESAYSKIRAGASLVQLYTGLIYEGPGLITQIKKGLVDIIERDGLARITDAVGLDT